MSFMCASEEFNQDEFSNFLLRRPALEAAMVLIDSCPFSLQNCNIENGLYRHWPRPRPWARRYKLFCDKHMNSIYNPTKKGPRENSYIFWQIETNHEKHHDSDGEFHCSTRCSEIASEKSFWVMAGHEGFAS